MWVCFLFLSSSLFLSSPLSSITIANTRYKLQQHLVLLLWRRRRRGRSTQEPLGTCYLVSKRNERVWPLRVKFFSVESWGTVQVCVLCMCMWYFFFPSLGLFLLWFYLLIGRYVLFWTLNLFCAWNDRKRTRLFRNKKVSEVFVCCQEQRSDVIHVCALWASLFFGFWLWWVGFLHPLCWFEILITSLSMMGLESGWESWGAVLSLRDLEGFCGVFCRIFFGGCCWHW